MAKSFIFSLLFLSCSISAQTFSKFIVVDQFGYTLNATKIAVIRDPQVGFDSSDSYTPGTEFNVYNANTDQLVFTAKAVPWNNGATHKESGDKVWWVDFSNFNLVGSYYIKDESTSEKSAILKIGNDVYKDVLKAAVKTFYYQRAGFEKNATFAGIEWADGASHLKPLQDKNCRLFNQKNIASTEKDLSGGWYDAGDYNKYTPWHANYLVSMLRMFEENKDVWTDDFNIPESGNGISDLVDEIKFGMDWLIKMNQPNGSSLCIVSLDYASPPSSATGQSVYGPATTNATLRSAAAMALGARILKKNYPAQYGEYSDTLKARAIRAYDWGLKNPSVIFNNNRSSNGSQGVGAGNQETDSLGRFTAKMSAALYLYELTKEKKYLDLFESNYDKLPMIAYGNYVSQYFSEQHNLLLHYTKLDGVNATIANKIKAAALAGIKKAGDFYAASTSKIDPYRSFIKDYNWGSNQYKADCGNIIWNAALYDLDIPNNEAYKKAAEGYLNYIHGVNPFSFVYLSNMSKLGAENNVKEFYHAWFADKSPKWDKEGESTYGPAPGFLVGGPNQFYEKDGCCPSNCGSPTNNALCNQNLVPPLNQPPMKSYKDFNDNWPINSWQISENSNGYQIGYIRLLSKFVLPKPTNADDQIDGAKINISPNPSTGTLNINLAEVGIATIKIYSISGQLVDSTTIKNRQSFTPNNIQSGTYIVKIEQNNLSYSTTWVVIK
jgi:endoglucanase